MIQEYIGEAKYILDNIDHAQIEEMVKILKNLKGRLFILGVGGSAANASHAVNDFRKVANIEAYAPTDNVAELTAWTNDLSWDEVFRKWLCESKLNQDDALLILSVGGGTKTASANLVNAVVYAKTYKATVLGIVGPEGGYTASYADVCIRIPTKEFKTPLTESFQQIIWHLIVQLLV